MQRTQRIASALLACALALGAIGCREEGPAERAGRAIDEAAEDVEDGLREWVSDEGPLERAGRKADEALEDALEKWER